MVEVVRGPLISWAAVTNLLPLLEILYLFDMKLTMFSAQSGCDVASSFVIFFGSNVNEFKHGRLEKSKEFPRIRMVS